VRTFGNDDDEIVFDKMYFPFGGIVGIQQNAPLLTVGWLVNRGVSVARIVEVYTANRAENPCAFESAFFV
jgi:hypothetical protein